MQVEFEYCPEDSVAFESETTPQRNVILPVIIGGVMIGIPGIAPALALGYNWVALMIAIVYFSCLVRYVQRLSLKPQPVTLAPGPMQVRLEPNYLEMWTDHNRGRIAWSHVERTVVERDFATLYESEQRKTPIPRRAFDTPHAMQEFVQLAEQYRLAAQETTPPEIGLYDDDFFAAWTRDAGLSVEYENSRADWSYVMEKGATEYPWQNRGARIGRNALYLVLSVIMGGMAFGVGHPGFTAFALVASAAFWYVGSITLLTIFREIRREQDIPADWLCRRNLFISPAGLISLTPFAIFCSDWLTLAVVQNTGFIYLTDTGGTVYYTTPKRAFPTFGQAEHFAHEAENWHEAAYIAYCERVAEEAEQVKRDAAPSDEENPFRSPQT
ncbi:YcxB family protein [Blastopirellula retiformator]|uniref:YcxB-like protein domain-containing protein n=1 Tax=Blastopirellula retiformator TaxID=2527970 RepID=A0A5C5V5C5_9BACT|nr:YcxB family protein [Blastopirellula retiformator]TWT32935.1 hypothetical protein Enr8_27510 [Blastopirellula retiformator]